MAAEFPGRKSMSGTGRARLWHLFSGMVRPQAALFIVWIRILSFRTEAPNLQMPSCSFPARKYDLRYPDCLSCRPSPGGTPRGGVSLALPPPRVCGAEEKAPFLAGWYSGQEPSTGGIPATASGHSLLPAWYARATWPAELSPPDEVCPWSPRATLGHPGSRRGRERTGT